MKVNTHSSVPPFALIKADFYTYLFLIVIMDFITDLLELNRYNALYIVVDHDLTKAIVFILCTKIIDAIRITKLYYDNVYWRFGLSNRIILDRGLQFLLQVF